MPFVASVSLVSPAAKSSVCLTSSSADASSSAASHAASEGIEQLRVHGDAAMDGLRQSAEDIEAQIVSAVREKPVTSLAIAAGIGFLFALISRR